jgi:hypothetical protein
MSVLRGRIHAALGPLLAAGFLAMLALGGACTGAGGADAVIAGMGNNGNMIGVDVLERLARELANLESAPRVTDDELVTAFAALREHAQSGDPDAALVLLRVAALQRDRRE